MVQDAQLLHAVGYGLANSREWPTWSSDSEFRSVRDQSDAERGATPPVAAPVEGQPAVAPAEPPPLPTKRGERG